LEAPLVFFNADFVKRRLMKIANAQRSGAAWFVLDAAAVNVVDSTGLEILEELRANLAAGGVTFGLADLNSRSRKLLDRAGVVDAIGRDFMFPSTEAAAVAFETRRPAAQIISPGVTPR
jgi:MFS superfamily sulfate permease-like transporter